MKRTLILAGVLALGVSACGGSSLPRAAAPTTTVAPSFLGTFAASDPSVTTVSPASLTALGNGVCTDFAEGDDAGTVAQEVIDAVSGTPGVMTTHQLGDLVTAATSILCPTYAAQWQTQLSQGI